MRYIEKEHLLDKQNMFICMFFRYMNISDEWETPEKQPFKDFVSVYLYLYIY